MRKKILLLLGLSVLAIFSIGIITSVLILNIPNEPDDCICKNWNPPDDFPYQYKRSPPYNETNICVFPDTYSYTNCKVYWFFNSSDNPYILVVMNAENYYIYEKLAYHRENGDIICHDGQFLPYVDYHIINIIPSLSGEGYWEAPYLDWWCFTFVNSELKPTMIMGMHGIGC